MLAIINFKAYKTGKEAVMLAKKCEKAARKEKISIALAVQTADIHTISEKVNIPVLAQHIDAIKPGAHTGWILPESAKESGAVGSLINHSEHKLQLREIKQAIQRLRENKMISVVCAGTPQMAEKIAKFKPNIIAIEPQELIGGNIAVSEAKPKVITITTRKIRKIPVLCGAGIKTKKDAEKAVLLGAKGILISSAITNSQNPEKSLRELLKGLKLGLMREKPELKSKFL